MAKNELVSLSILYGAPKHAYAINTLIKEFSLEEWTTISKASIYNCLGRLEKKGLVEVTHEKVGNMPERKVYNITKKGIVQLAVETREALLVDEATFERFFIAILFGLGISGEEMIKLLVQKKSHIRSVIVSKIEHVEELKKHGITHAIIMLNCVIQELEIILKSIDDLIIMLEKNSDYYYQNMEKCMNLYEQEEH